MRKPGLFMSHIKRVKDRSEMEGRTRKQTAMREEATIDDMRGSYSQADAQSLA